MRHEIFEKAFVLPRHSLCYNFKEISKRTWSLLKNAHDFQLPINEETITEINLLELKQRMPNHIFTWTLNKHQESLIGADWIWAFTSRNGKTILLYVQAKRLFQKTQSYDSLLHPGQSTRLVSNFWFSVFGYGTYPIYVLYNYLDGHVSHIQCNCGMHKPVDSAGCSYADAFAVKQLIDKGRDSLVDLYPTMYSWECLVCNDCNTGPKVDLATNTFNKINSYANLTDTNNSDRPRPELLGARPEFVQSIINGESPKNLDVYKDSQLRGIVVITE